MNNIWFVTLLGGEYEQTIYVRAANRRRAVARAKQVTDIEEVGVGSVYGPRLFEELESSEQEQFRNDVAVFDVEPV
ncbi:hypothetical protein LCGC14_2545840 [marine sediment metagenome]|uniref:Uncharacterized protein n=1 Tax=marine sediment metagenome TaxID=412755 RepID=A0A0F9D0S8_9ZZZZ